MSNKQTKVISPDWTLMAPLPELLPSLSAGEFSFLYSDLRSFKGEAAHNREAPTPGHSWSPKESRLSIDSAQDCWTLEKPAVSAAPKVPTKLSCDVQHFFFFFWKCTRVSLHWRKNFKQKPLSVKGGLFSAESHLRLTYIRRKGTCWSKSCLSQSPCGKTPRREPRQKSRGRRTEAGRPIYRRLSASLTCETPPGLGEHLSAKVRG